MAIDWYYFLSSQLPRLFLATFFMALHYVNYLYYNILARNIMERTVAILTVLIVLIITMVDGHNKDRGGHKDYSSSSEEGTYIICLIL